MKTITYSLSQDDKTTLGERVKFLIKSELEKYNKNPKHYNTRSLDLLKMSWQKIAIVQACFELFERDGLAHIEKWDDETYELDHLLGDCFCPIANPDIDPAELKRQKRNYLARINRQGVHGHTLHVLGNELDSIGGFVGNDFYGSGYDVDFYNAAFNTLRDNHDTREYIANIIDFFVSAEL